MPRSHALRAALLTVAVLASGCGAGLQTGASHSAPPPADGGSMRPQPPTERVTGTRWAGMDSDGDDYVFYFQPDGSLHYRSPSGFWTNGTWKQKGSSIYLEMDGQYTQYLGTITGETMKGNAWNSAGRTWTWSVQKLWARG